MDLKKFLKYSNNIVALYVLITKDKIIGKGNAYYVEMSNEIFPNIKQNYLITTRHLQSLILTDYNNLKPEYKENEIIVRSNNMKLNIPILDYEETEDLDYGSTLLIIEDIDLLDKLYKFKKLYKEAEILLTNDNKIICNADSLTIEFDYPININLSHDINLHFILDIVDPVKLEITDKAIIGYDENNIKLVAFESVLIEHPELVVDSENIKEDEEEEEFVL